MSASRHCLTMSQAWSTGILVKRDSTSRLTRVSGWMVVLGDGMHEVLAWSW